MNPYDKITAKAPQPKLQVEVPAAAPGRRIDGQSFIDKHGLDASGPVPYEGGKRWTFNTSPLCDCHEGQVLIQFPSGALYYSCAHNTCKSQNSGNRWVELRTKYEPMPERASDGKPVITINENVPRIVEQMVDALRDSDTYQSLNRLVRIDYNPPRARYSQDDNGAPRISFLQLGATLELLTRVARYERFDKKQKEYVASTPSRELREAVYCRGEYPGVPSLRSVVCRPILLPDGTIVAESGYHADTELFLHVDGAYPAIMETKAAVELLFDAFHDFPFESDPHRSACIAALLTLLARNIIYGSTPFFSFDGNRPGCGKGLATNVIALIAEGRLATRYAQTDDGKELKKALTSVAIAGQPYILFDNVSGRFGGPVIEGAITCSSINDRLLGQSKTVDIPLRITWLATANNAAYTDDMVRRVCTVMMNTEEERPEERTGFRHPRLERYVKENRKQLLMAGLSIVANYIRAGRPDQKLSAWGGFEEWSELIRGSIVWAGLADPYETRSDLIQAHGGSTLEWLGKLMNAWTFQSPMKMPEIIQAVLNDEGNKHFALRDLLNCKPESCTDAEYLGKLLRRAKGCVVDGRRFTHDGKAKRGWYLESEKLPPIDPVLEDLMS